MMTCPHSRCEEVDRPHRSSCRALIYSRSTSLQCVMQIQKRLCQATGCALPVSAWSPVPALLFTSKQCQWFLPIPGRKRIPGMAIAAAFQPFSLNTMLLLHKLPECIRCRQYVSMPIWESLSFIRWLVHRYALMMCIEHLTGGGD